MDHSEHDAPLVQRGRGVDRGTLGLQQQRRRIEPSRRIRPGRRRCPCNEGVLLNVYDKG
jgi:hypothetical protein